MTTEITVTFTVENLGVQQLYDALGLTHTWPLGVIGVRLDNESMTPPGDRSAMTKARQQTQVQPQGQVVEPEPAVEQPQGQDVAPA